MKNHTYVAIGSLAVLLVGVLVTAGCIQPPGPTATPTPTTSIEPTATPTQPQASSTYPGLEPGEWYPDKDTDCQSPEFMDKCDEFCSNHPEYCPGWEADGGPRQGLMDSLHLPAEQEISSLTRRYPAIIKCVNEGPAIYAKGKAEVISDKKLEEIKETGFNTVQIYLMGKREASKTAFDEGNNIVLLNDIVAIKKHGLAVWVALDISSGPPGIKLGPYDEYKLGYLDFVRESAELMEGYNVEYLTINNEPDNSFKAQAGWGSEKQINKNLAEFFPLVNAIAREKFSGKIINKITLVREHDKTVIDASLQNVDIAGVDVGAPMELMSVEEYKEWFDDYQFYATAAQEKGIPWMNAEYWQYDFELSSPSQFIKDNQAKYAKISFDAYLSTSPKGVGYVWNDFGTFSLEPNGQATQQEIEKFFSAM